MTEAGGSGAAARWLEQLEAWALPERLLASVPDSPYGFPPELWKRRTRLQEESAVEPVTTGVARGLAMPAGSLLDVGAGTGRASLALAAEGHHLTAVEPNEGMAAALRAEAARIGVEVRVVPGRWPEVATAAGAADVVLCAHVVYDVADIVPFVAALNGAARRAVVVELTPAHPWRDLAPYYFALHDLTRPEGPTAADFVAVVHEVVGLEPRRQDWRRPAGLRFATMDELLAFYRRRLLIPTQRLPELEGLLLPDVHDEDGWLTLGPPERELVTVWWER